MVQLPPILHFLTPQRPLPILDYHAHAAAAIKNMITDFDSYFYSTVLLLCGAAEPVDRSLSIQFPKQYYVSYEYIRKCQLRAICLVFLLMS